MAQIPLCLFLSPSLSLSLSLSLLSTKQDKPAFIFCVEDRALFCQDCDEPIHSAGSLSAKHQRFLATGISVALSSSCKKDTEESCLEPPHQKSQQIPMKMPAQQNSSFSSPWAVDDLLQFSDVESSDKVRTTSISKSKYLFSVDVFGCDCHHKE
jgi:hypothetical protein